MKGWAMAESTAAAVDKNPPSEGTILKSPELEHSLFRLGRAIRRITFPHCSKEASSVDGAGFWQLVILQELGPQRPSDLANILSLDISTVSRQLKQLEAAGLVKRKVHEHDARAYLMMVTASGANVLDEIVKLRQNAISEVVGKWSKEDVQSLLQLMERLTIGIEKQVGIRNLNQ